SGPNGVPRSQSFRRLLVLPGQARGRRLIRTPFASASSGRAARPSPSDGACGKVGAERESTRWLKRRRAATTQEVRYPHPPLPPSIHPPSRRGAHALSLPPLAPTPAPSPPRAPLWSSRSFVATPPRRRAVAAVLCVPDPARRSCSALRPQRCSRYWRYSDSCLKKGSTGGLGASRLMSQPSTQPFDLCPNYQESTKAKTTTPREQKKRKAGESSTEAASVQHLRFGMDLSSLKIKSGWLVCVDNWVRAQEDFTGQASRMVPSYLWMMSLGKNWDPTARSYGPTRPFDGAQAPTIPDAFKMIAQTANSTASESPQITPDICIVNYYTNSGKLGLHQDKDESESTLTKGLPFISISIGDTAEFLFGDTRDKDQATKINLESGDILILGGESRLLFHGVSHVKTNTASSWLKEETGIRPGRGPAIRGRAHGANRHAPRGSPAYREYGESAAAVRCASKRSGFDPLPNPSDAFAIRPLSTPRRAPKKTRPPLPARAPSSSSHRRLLASLSQTSPTTALPAPRRVSPIGIDLAVRDARVHADAAAVHHRSRLNPASAIDET
ncbi:hypothetical protein U9M48_003774, partial [Paspalum notatum var. saurae]